MALSDETVDDSGNFEIFDPDITWKRKILYNFEARELQVQVFRGGEYIDALLTTDVKVPRASRTGYANVYDL